MNWPANFHLLGDPHPREVEISDSQGQAVAAVVGAGHDSPTEDRNLVPRFPESRGLGIPTVGLLHTFVTTAKSAEQHDRYAPCSSQDLDSRNYAYWALGHVHEHQQVIGEVDAWYPGILQGRHPGEAGLKGGLMVSIPNRGSTSVEFRAFSRAVWEKLVLDQLRDVANLSELRKLAAAAFEVKREANPSVTDWMLRFELEGPCPLTDLLRDRNEVESLEEELRTFLDVPFVEVRSRRLSPFCDIESYRGDVHVLSEILAFIDEASENEDLLEELSPQVLAGPVDEFRDKKDYLKGLLGGLDFEVVDRLVSLADARQ
jgi:DNA repair exonuclease SbcCD nuclease subunit